MSKNINLLLQGPSSFSPSKISSLNFELNLTNDSPIEELNIYEIAEVMEVSTGRVSQIKTSAIKRIREQLRKEI